jgi:hypothetical protein
MVKAWPLGVGLSGKEGTYHFDHVCPGRYALVVKDEKAGYPHASPAGNAFLYGVPIQEVTLTAKNPQAELPVYLPPKPGFMQVHVTNQETKAEIWKFRVMLKVPGQQYSLRLDLFVGGTPELECQLHV